jgi:hypothetical protein
MHSDVRVKLIKTIPRRQIDLIYQVSCTSIDHIDPGRGVLPRATLAPSALASLATDPGRCLERAKESHPPGDRASERGPGNDLPARDSSAWPTGPQTCPAGPSSPVAWHSPGGRGAARLAGLAAGPCAPASPFFLFSFSFCLLYYSLSIWATKLGH